MLAKQKLNFIFIVFFLLFIQLNVYAGRIKGKIFDDHHNPLPFSSITVKEINKKFVSNAEGEYTIDLSNGIYTLICQHVGYATLTREIHVKEIEHQYDFHLKPNELSLTEVIWLPCPKE